MDNEQMLIKLQETTDRSLRNEGRIEKLEGKHEVLEQLVTSVAVMAEQMKNMNKSVSTLTDKVDAIEEKPGKRWDSLVDKIVWAVAAALIGFILAQIGL